MSLNASRYACTATALLLFICASYILSSPCSHNGADSMNPIGVYRSSSSTSFLTTLFVTDRPRRPAGSTTNSLATTGRDSPIDTRSERSEFVNDVLHDKFDPAILPAADAQRAEFILHDKSDPVILPPARPEKLIQITPAALLAAYMRIPCIVNHLPVGVTVYDFDSREIPVTVHDAVFNSSSRSLSINNSIR